MDGRTDGSITISLCIFVDEWIIIWKEDSQRIMHIQQYNAVCNDTCEFSVGISVTISAKKNYVRFVFTSSCLQNACLIYVICFCLCIVVSNTYCVVFFFVFLLLVYPMLPVLLDCPFFIALSVFSCVYLGIQYSDGRSSSSPFRSQTENCPVK